MRQRLCFTTLSLLSLGALAGCDASSRQDPNQPNTKTNPQSLLMQRATSCEDLDVALRAEARLQLARQQEVNYGMGARGAVVDDDGSWVAAGGSTSAGPVTSAPTSPPTGIDTGTPGASESGADDPSAREYSETNAQVAGVDEADIIKTDGENLYVLRSGDLTVAKAYPVDAMTVLAKQPVEGTPREMFVVAGADAAGTQVVVYSDVDATPLYEAAGIPLPVTDDAYYYDGYAYESRWVPATKATVLTITAAGVTVDKELYYEGAYLSSRRNGAAVRTTLQVPSRSQSMQVYADDADYTKAQMMVIQDLLDADRDVAGVPADELDAMVDEALTTLLAAKAETKIASISHADWLPRTFIRSGTELLVESLPCDAFYIPATGSTSAGVTFIAQLDLEHLAADGEHVALLGLADTLYENGEKVVLSSNYWSYSPADGESSSQTLIHQFDVSEPGSLVYEASGQVPGSVHNQFSLDQRGDALRVVTTDRGNAASNWVTTTGLYILQPNGTELVTTGEVDGLAPGEQVYSARFVGDKAYVVTFRQIDPLFVLDVADPTAPVLLGELKIPGFSEYMHPLGDHHLLTIGRDGDEAGSTGNVALQIFDVTSPVEPTLAHKHVFATFGASEAEYNHKAFSFFAQHDLLALPFYSQTWDDQGYFEQSALELFQVSVTDGFTPLGALAGDLLLSTAEQSGDFYCSNPSEYGRYETSTIDRGLYIEDTLFAVGQRGIIASMLASPAEAVAVLPFEDPAAVPENCWSVAEGGSGIGGAEGGTVGGAETGVVGGAPSTGGSSGGDEAVASGGSAVVGVGGTGAI